MWGFDDLFHRQRLSALLGQGVSVMVVCPGTLFLFFKREGWTYDRATATVNSLGKCGIKQRHRWLCWKEMQWQTAMETLAVICFSNLSCLGLSLRLLMSTCLAATHAWVASYAWCSFIVCGYKACRAFIIGPVVFSQQLISETFPSPLHTHAHFWRCRPSVNILVFDCIS